MKKIIHQSFALLFLVVAVLGGTSLVAQEHSCHGNAANAAAADSAASNTVVSNTVVSNTAVSDTAASDTAAAATPDSTTSDRVTSDRATHDTASAHAHHQAPLPAPASAKKLGELDIPNVELLDQAGREVRVHDLLAGKLVAMNFVFTTCTTVCPPMGAHFARLQQQLGDRAVELISVSIDPTTDTPQRLAAWSEKFGAQEGWTLVTGKKLEVDKLLKALGVFTPDFADHSPVILVGDASRDRWIRAYGLAPPDQILALLDQAAQDRDFTAEQEMGR